MYRITLVSSMSKRLEDKKRWHRVLGQIGQSFTTVIEPEEDVEVDGGNCQELNILF